MESAPQKEITRDIFTIEKNYVEQQKHLIAQVFTSTFSKWPLHLEIHNMFLSGILDPTKKTKQGSRFGGLIGHNCHPPNLSGHGNCHIRTTQFAH